MKDYLKTMRPQGIQQQLQEAVGIVKNEVLKDTKYYFVQQNTNGEETKTNITDLLFKLNASENIETTTNEKGEEIPVRTDNEVRVQRKNIPGVGDVFVANIVDKNNNKVIKTLGEVDEKGLNEEYLKLNSFIREEKNIDQKNANYYNSEGSYFYKYDKETIYDISSISDLISAKDKEIKTTDKSSYITINFSPKSYYKSGASPLEYTGIDKNKTKHEDNLYFYYPQETPDYDRFKNFDVENISDVTKMLRYAFVEGKEGDILKATSKTNKDLDLKSSFHEYNFTKEEAEFIKNKFSEYYNNDREGLKNNFTREELFELDNIVKTLGGSNNNITVYGAKDRYGYQNGFGVDDTKIQQVKDNETGRKYGNITFVDMMDLSYGSLNGLQNTSFTGIKIRPTSTGLSASPFKPSFTFAEIDSWRFGDSNNFENTYNIVRFFETGVTTTFNNHLTATTALNASLLRSVTSGGSELGDKGRIGFNLGVSYEFNSGANISVSANSPLNRNTKNKTEISESSYSYGWSTHYNKIEEKELFRPPVNLKASVSIPLSDKNNNSVKFYLTGELSALIDGYHKREVKINDITTYDDGSKESKTNFFEENNQALKPNIGSLNIIPKVGVSVKF